MEILSISCWWKDKAVAAWLHRLNYLSSASLSLLPWTCLYLLLHRLLVSQRRCSVTTLDKRSKYHERVDINDVIVSHCIPIQRREKKLDWKPWFQLLKAGKSLQHWSITSADMIKALKRCSSDVFFYNLTQIKENNGQNWWIMSSEILIFSQ